MAMWLRYNTASQEVPLGPFLDDTDGKTQETALTIANTDIKLWKEGGLAEVNKNSGGATHMNNGRYYIVLDATDTNTFGKLEINVHVSGALPVRREFMVLPANVFDSLVFGNDYLDVSAVQLAGQTITAAAGVTFPSSVASPTNITAGTITTTTNLTNLPSIPAGWLTAAGIAASALNGKGDWNIGKTGYSLTQTFPTNFASMSISVAGLVNIGTGSGLTAVPWNATWDAEVQSEVQDAIEANHLDHLLAVDYDPAAKPGVATALLNELVGDDAGVSQFTINALENAPSGTGASAASIVAAMFNTDSGETNASAVAGSPVYEIVQNSGGGGGPTAAAIRAEIDTNSTQLAAIRAKTDNLPTDPADASDIAASFSGVNTKLDTIDDFLDTEIAGIKTKTDFLPSATAGAAGGLFIAGTNAATTVNFTGNLSGSVGSVTGAVGSVTGAVASVTAGVTLAAATHTGAVIPTVTNLTNLPSIPAGWLTAAGIAASALNGKGDWNVGKTGYTLTQAFPANFSSLSVTVGGGVTVATNGDKTGYSLAQAFPANFGVMSISLAGEVTAVGGGGGTADWTADQKTVLMAVLGIPATGTIPTDPTTGILDTIRDQAVAIKAKTDALPIDPADASDIAASFVTVNTKIDAVQADTDNIQTRLPAALVGGRMDSNLGAINNDTATVTALKRGVDGNCIGTVGAGSTTTSIVSSALTPAGSVLTQFKGRSIVFDRNTTTAALRGQATDITSSTAAAAPTFTVTALTTSPVAGDTFSIV